jgi:hypothetical protein
MQKIQISINYQSKDIITYTNKPQLGCHTKSDTFLGRLAAQSAVAGK